MGRILCSSFQPIIYGQAAEPYTLRGDVKPFKRRDPIDDSKLVVAIRDELEKYDMIVTWNGKLFDAPFLNARLAKHRERPFHPHFHLDAMWYAGGSSMRVGSKKLVNVQKFLGLTASKTDISWEQWQRAGAMDKKAMDEVVEHCEADVQTLAEAYWHLLPYVANLHR